MWFFEAIAKVELVSVISAGEFDEQIKYFINQQRHAHDPDNNNLAGFGCS